PPTFANAGTDRHRRETTLRLAPAPDLDQGTTVSYRIALDPQRAWQLTIHGELIDRAGRGIEATPAVGQDGHGHQLLHTREGAVEKGMEVETGNELFNQVLERSVADLQMPSMRQQG